MRKKLVLALAVPFVAVGMVYGWHLVNRPSENQLGDTLRSFGYLPLALPTSEMSVGTLYHVDSKVRFFDVVCDAQPADIEPTIKRSKSGEMQMDLLTNGQFDTGVKIDLDWMLKFNGTANEKQTVHFSLTDIVTESISLEENLEIFARMVERPRCNRAVMQVIRNGGYVCQGLKVLEATAEYKLDRDTQSKIGVNTTTASDVNNIVKLAVETQSGQEVVERQGKVQSGKKLKYAVAMNPDCMAPPTGRFRRVLPESVVGRMTNYVLFHIIEPYWPFWPAEEGETRRAEGPMHLTATE